MDKSQSFYVRFKMPMMMLAIIIVVTGFFSLSKMKSSLFPQTTFPKIKIIADAGQQPVDQMTATITKPLEEAVKQIPNLLVVRSTTSRGSCEISAFIDWKADVDLSVQQIESRINQVRNQLPPDVNITVEKMNPSILPVMGFSLNSGKMEPFELKKLALYTIKPFLSQVPGVSEVRVIGGQDKEYRVILDQMKMSKLGITPSSIAEVLSKTNFIQSNGYFSEYNYLYLTLTDTQLKNLDQLKNIVIRNDGSRIVYFSDIANIELHNAKQYIRVNANGEESILIAVVQQPDANVVDVSKAMNEKIDELKKTLPNDIVIKPYYDQAIFVNDSIRSVSDALWIGLVFAIIVAILFLRSWRSSLAILVTIPITILLTIIILYATRQTFNIMTLGAIAASIGLIIDDAIVVVEQIHRTHEENIDEGSEDLIHVAINYLFKAMVGSSLSTIVIFIPFVLMSGVAGAYFKVMTNTMLITLVCSFFVSWLLLPVIYLFLSKFIREKNLQSHVVKERKWVGFFIDKPIFSYAFIVFLIIATMFIIPNLSSGFLPEMDEGGIVLDYKSAPGTSLEETDRELRELEIILREIPEVEAYSRRTGTQMGFFITEPNNGDYLIQLKKKKKKTTIQVIDEIRSAIEAHALPLTVDFGQVIGDNLGDLMSSVQPIEIKIFGKDNDVIQNYSRKVAAIVENVKGTADVFDGIVIAGPSVQIIPNLSVLGQYNITPQDFQFQVQTMIEGNEVGKIFEKQQYTPIRIMYNNNNNSSLNKIQNGLISLPNGQLKPLKEFADVKVIKGVAENNREDLQNIGVVTARLDNANIGGTVKEIRKEINRQIKLPTGYSIVYGGAYAEQKQSFSELLMILILSSLLVFSVILFLYRNVVVAGLILFISILGNAGSLILLFISGTSLNVGSYIGLIMMVGIIGENAIFTYLQFQTNLKENSKKEALIYAISTRLRPKLMTAIGAITALMPLALGIGTGAQMHQPLAIAVIGGFIFALPLLLVVLPTLLNKIKYQEEIKS